MGDIETIYGWVAVGWRGHDNREAFEALDRLEAELNRLREENERLREELDDKRLSRYEPAYVGDLEEENERLREELVDVRYEASQYLSNLHATEVERDRAREALAMRFEASKTDMSELRRQVDAIRAGNERIAELEAANERLRERGDWAVEQLRLAEAAGEELREQLSLNRIHDRDCAAREDRLRRIEEAAKTWRNRSDARALGLKDPDGTVGDALEDLRAALADQPAEEKA